MQEEGSSAADGAGCGVAGNLLAAAALLSNSHFAQSLLRVLRCPRAASEIAQLASAAVAGMSPLTGLCSACRIEKVTDFLEGHIDPFDLDVFTPHLNSNLNRLVQRTSVSPGKKDGLGSRAAKHVLRGSWGGFINCLMHKDNDWHLLRNGKSV